MTRRVRIPASKYQESLATWRRYRNAVESLGLDVRFPFVREDDCRFRQVESILAEFGGVVPRAPLPSGWEGSRPTCYDGTLHGLLEYLRWATSAQSGDDDYPPSGPIFHYNRALRNAHRMLLFLGIRDLLVGVPKAKDVCDGMGQIHSLAAFVCGKIEEGSKPKRTEGIPSAASTRECSTTDTDDGMAATSVVIDYGHECFALYAGKRRVSLPREFAKWVGAFAQRVAKSAPDEIIGWSELISLNNEIQADGNKASQSVRNMLSDLRSHLSRLGTPIQGPDWLVTHKGKGVSLNNNIRWTLSRRLLREFTERKSKRGAPVDPYKMAKNTPAAGQKLPVRPTRPKAEPCDDQD